MAVVAFILLQPDADYYVKIMRELNRDSVYFPDGSLKNILLWDDKGAVAIGTGDDNEIVVINKEDYKEIDQNILLRYLNMLI